MKGRATPLEILVPIRTDRTLATRRDFAVTRLVEVIKHPWHTIICKPKLNTSNSGRIERGWCTGDGPFRDVEFERLCLELKRWAGWMKALANTHRVLAGTNWQVGCDALSRCKQFGVRI